MANFRKPLAYAAALATLANPLAPAAHAASAGYIGNLFKTLTGSASDANGEGLTASGQTYQYRLDGANIQDGTVTPSEISGSAGVWNFRNEIRVGDSAGTRTGSLGSDATGPWVGSQSNHPFRFITNGAERARFSELGTLTGNGGFVLGGFGSYSKSYSVPTATQVPVEWQEGTTALNNAYSYRFVLVTEGTGTDTAAVYVVWYNEPSAAWSARRVSAAGLTSNHPQLAIAGSDAVAFHTHGSTYTIRVSVTYQLTNEPDRTVHAFGAESMWQRLGNDLSYTDGMVGVGTATPQALFDLGAGLGVDVTQRFSALNGAGNSTRGFISVGATTGLMTFTSDQGANGTDRGFSFVTQATERARIDGAGNITVASNLRSGSGVTNMAANGVAWWMAGWGNGPAVMLQQHSAAGGNANRRGSLGWSDNVGAKTEMVTWDESGNVAVGTTNPRAKLHVYGSNPELRVDYSTSNNYWGSFRWAGLQLGNNGWNRIVAGRSTAGGAMAFYTNNTNDAADYNVTPDGNLALALLANGNVGVGQSTAAYRLDVNGDVIANWLRTRGNTGWYNETYGGGVYMNDSTWVQTYNNKAFRSASGIVAGYEMQAPRFVDGDNTAYQLDPSASSVVNNLTVSGTLAISSALSAPGFTATTSMSAPIYYDSDNAGYYLNPASTSNLNAVSAASLQLGTVGNITENSVSTYGSIRLSQAKNGYFGILFGNAVGSPNLMFDGSGNGGMYYEGGAGWATYMAASTGNYGIGTTTTTYKLNVGGNMGAVAYYDWNNAAFYVDPASTSIMNDVRGNIFYDQGNTAYYVDPASTSNVNNLTVNGTLTANVTRLASSGDYVWNSATLASALPHGVTNSFVRAADGFPNYGTLINARGYSGGGGGAVQIYAPYGSTYGGTSLQYRTADYTANPAAPPWTAFKTIIDSGNIGSQSVANADTVDGYHASGLVTNAASDAGGFNRGDWQVASSTNGNTAYTTATLELRESNFGGAANTAPRLSFHWGGVVASQIGVESSGRIAVLDNPGTGYENIIAKSAYFTSFTDTDNGAYYVDPGSSSNVNNLTVAGTLYANNWIYSANRAGLYNSTYGTHLYASDASYMRLSSNRGLIFNDTTGYDSAVSGYVYHDASGFGLLASDGNWRLRTYVGGQQLYGTTISDDLRANILYDQGNTAYYVDPAGTSNVNNLTVNGTLTASVSATQRVTSFDNRIIAPSEDSANALRFGFTSYTNNNAAPWADYLHFRSYGDASGGNDNLMVLNKSGFGARIYQQSFGSATAYASYKDVVLAENSPTANYVPKYSGVGNNVSVTNSQIVDNGTNVGIGIAPSFKLHVAGNAAASILYDTDNTGYYVDPSATSSLNTVQGGAFYASNWFRSTGVSGWYSETYGGGIYMTDTTWVRAYNGKSLWTSATMRADGSMQSPIYYDLDDNGYYVDPASTTRVNNLRFNTADCVNGFCPAGGVVRMTPNLHLNSGQGNALIVNWDNGAVAGTTWQFRVGNGSSADAFYVRADGNVWAGGSVKTTCVGNCF